MKKQKEEKPVLPVADADTPYTPSPDLVYVGEQEASDTVVRVFDFSTGDLVEKQVDDLSTLAGYLGAEELTWVDWVGLKNVGMLSGLCERLEIHPLHVEDLLHMDQHPKVEDTEHYTLVFLRRLHRPAPNEELQSDQISFVITNSELVTIRESDHGVFNSVQARLRNSRGKIRNMGADYLAYSLLDTIIDGYFGILTTLEDQIEDLQDEILEKPEPELMIKMHNIRSDLLIARRSLWPLREAVLALERSPAITRETEPFMRDAYDHTVKLADSLDFTRDLLNAAMESYMTAMNNRMNETMRLLTSISLIFMPLTFLAGVYGMNFKHMPELGWKYGYLVCWVVMVVIAIVMVCFFRRRKWL